MSDNFAECERFEKNDHRRAICRNEMSGKPLDGRYGVNEYRASWGLARIEQLEPKLPVPNPPRQNSREPVGTAVSEILTSLGIAHTGCGGCLNLIQDMDQGGLAWCDSHREAILTRLRDRAKAASWWTTRKAELLALTTGLAWSIDWADPAPGILDQAMRSVRISSRK